MVKRKEITYDYAISREWCESWGEDVIFSKVFKNNKNDVLSVSYLLHSDVLSLDEKAVLFLHEDFLDLPIIENICSKVIKFAVSNSNQLPHITESEVTKMNNLLKSKQNLKYLHLCLVAECLTDGSMEFAVSLLKEKI